MSDISVSERRLSAALDRIDQLLEQGLALSVPDDRSAEQEQGELEKDLAVARAENARLAYELAALRAAGDVPPDAALADLRKRLDDLGHQTVRLAAANDQLSAANGDLLAAAAGRGDFDAAANAAKDAEIAALKSARLAEAAQLEEVLFQLERLLSAEPGQAGPDAMIEAAGDAAGIPESEPAGSGFSGIYPDKPETGEHDGDMESEGR